MMMSEPIASEAMVMSLLARIEREGHHLTNAAVSRMHEIINGCIPDNRPEGNQRELAQFLRERIERDKP